MMLKLNFLQHQLHLLLMRVLLRWRLPPLLSRLDYLRQRLQLLLKLDYLQHLQLLPLRQSHRPLGHLPLQHQLIAP